VRSAPQAWAKIQFPRIWVNVFFSLVGAVTFVLGFVLTRTARGWVLGQWLISYEGGFVRRGLPGEVFYLLGKLFHVSPVAFLLVSCFALYALIFVSVRSLAMASSRNVWLMALLLSPATFWFQILHPHNGFNKEILYLATLSVFAVLLSKFQISGIMASLYMSIAVVLVVLSHEGMVFYAPYFFALLVISGKTVRQAAIECSVPALLGLAVAYLCSQHSGNVEAASQICSSLGYKLDLEGNSQICAGGAIAYFTRSMAYARANTLDSMRKYHFLVVFPIFAAIAILPAVAESARMLRSRMKREVAVLWTTVVISFLGTVILFVYAYDWNRWIYIHIASITVLLLFMDGKIQRKSGDEAPPNRQMTVKRQAAWAVIYVLYAILCFTPNAIQAASLGFLNRLTHSQHAMPPAAS
jgi:hypothetical protein